MIYNASDTIVAISTPKGVGGIGIVRLSGLNSFSIACLLSKKNKLVIGVNYVSYFCGNGFLIDQGLILYFKQPKSFTGEDVIELHAHGNDIILDSLVYRCIELGARMADHGEFSFRAYLNGRIDLVQAESINSIINSQSSYSNSFILKSLLGYFSDDVKSILNDISVLRANLEASIEFPDHVDFVFSDFKIAFFKIYEKYNKFFESVSSNNTFCDALSVVILGNVNTGKSSLFNCLLNKDRSIVSDIPGTTRDFIDSFVFLNGFKFKLIDTAGFNFLTNDYLEKISIARTFDQIRFANILICVSDVSDNVDFVNNDFFKDVLNMCVNKIKVILLKNKIDLFSMDKKVCIHDDYVEIFASVKNNYGIDFLINELVSTVSVLQENFYFASKRQFDLLVRVKKCFDNILCCNMTYTPLDFYAESLTDIYTLLSDVLGIYAPDDVLRQIFSQFCVGK